MYVTFLLYLCRRIEKATFDNLVLYPNPYIVVTKKGYTKHYYAGSEKIAAAIGQGWLFLPYDPIDRMNAHEKFTIKELSFKGYYNEDPFMHERRLKEQEATQDIYGDSFEELNYQTKPLYLNGLAVNCKPNILEETIYANSRARGREDMVFFNHSDYLGYANWVTDADARIVHEYYYAPYGELIIDNSWDRGYNERYKFTGKERDGETGYDYFGARYFWSALGHWLSVDPLADKYPGISPYAYCAWNPIKFVDPDGRNFDEANEGTAQKIEAELFTKKIYSALGNNQQMRELYTTWKDIQGMRADESREYRFETVPGAQGGDTYCAGTNNKGHQIITMSSATFDKLNGLSIHEVRHGGQIARGEWFYNGKTPENYGVMKEVDAYKAQWAWDGYLYLYGWKTYENGLRLPGVLRPSYNEINPRFVNSITNDRYEPTYPPIGLDIMIWNNH